MAGAFTHLVVSSFAKREKKVLGRELWQTLNRHYRFVYLGSVSPDLPYLSFRTGSINWADVMHYEKTNSIVKSGHSRIKDIWPDKSEIDEIKLAWLLGYASHMITDATIHPIVQAIVGPYKDNPKEHLRCELTQDSLLFHEKMNDDIKYDEFSEMLRFCSESEYLDPLMDFWQDLLLRNYGEKGETPHPDLWFKTYGPALDTAEGDMGLIPFFNQIGIDTSGLIYRTKTDIEQNYPQELNKYYAKIRLPNDKTGFFLKDGYERAMANVAAAWRILYEGLTGPLVVSDVVRNWDLDTGVDMDSPAGEVTYWR
jgi:hypothetical protein